MEYFGILLAIAAAIIWDEHISLKRHRRLVRNQYKIICALEMLMEEHNDSLEADNKYKRIRKFAGEIQEQLR